MLHIRPNDGELFVNDDENPQVLVRAKRRDVLHNSQEKEQQDMEHAGKALETLLSYFSVQSPIYFIFYRMLNVSSTNLRPPQ